MLRPGHQLHTMQQKLTLLLWAADCDTGGMPPAEDTGRRLVSAT